MILSLSIQKELLRTTGQAASVAFKVLILISNTAFLLISSYESSHDLTVKEIIDIDESLFEGETNYKYDTKLI